jgi:alkanesulfonate monooxygenase SsuD/methylene tetrahydromethanopterin reductase-like flavin-dependent oxidoreductase (luciferase family)
MIVRSMFTQDAFDFAGRHYTLTNTRNEPKPVQPGGPPILVGGTGDRMLRLVAERADIWTAPGPPHGSLEFLADRSRMLDRHCADLGRDPIEVTRSVQLMFTADDPAAARQTVRAVIGLGFQHVVLAVRGPVPANIARWLADEIIIPVRQDLALG